MSQGSLGSQRTSGPKPSLVHGVCRTRQFSVTISPEVRTLHRTCSSWHLSPKVLLLFLRLWPYLPQRYRPRRQYNLAGMIYEFI